MYQFTTSTILNSNLDSNGTTAKISGSAAAFGVTRVGTFKKANIVSVYKRPYAAGVKEVANLTVASGTAGLVYRLTIDVRLSQQTDSEYANFSLSFRKPVVVEIVGAASADTNADAFIAQINGLKDRFGSSYIVATKGAANHIILTATNNNQRFYSIVQEEELAIGANSIIQPEYKVVAGGILNGLTAVNGVVLTAAGSVGFGDDEYMIRSIMLPTYENSRYFGTNKEERPVLNGNYTQYTLRYSITKDGQDGIVAGGTSITTHVFYASTTQLASVGVTVAQAFEAALSTTLASGLIQLITIGGDQDIIITGDEAIASTTTGYTVSNIASTSAFSALVYSDEALTTASSATAKVTASGGSESSGSTASAGSTGAFTFTVTKVQAGTVYVKVYETGNTAKYASMKIVIS